MGRKRIFISDIHMGTEEGVVGVPGKHPYAWLREPNISRLAAFLERVIADPDVAELFILGDLFDDWIIPASNRPAAQIYETIFSSKANRGIIDALKRIDAGGRITLHYVPGNHDMTLTEDFLKSKFPNLIWHGDSPEGGMGRFRDEAGSLVAEHGHRYTLFNCPDEWTDRGNGFPQELPYGYYVSRTVAEKLQNTGGGEDYLDILAKGIKALAKGQPLMESILDGIAGDAGLSDASEIQLSGGGEVSIAQAKDRYRYLYYNWADHAPARGRVDSSSALAGEEDKLIDTARKMYHDGNPLAKAKIAIFGHTHIHCMDTSPSELEDEFFLHEPYEFIYVNSGTWVNNKDDYSTYVETEIDETAKRHHVRLCKFDGNASGVLEKGFVAL